MNLKRSLRIAAIFAALLAIAGTASARANGPVWRWNGALVGGPAEKIKGIPISGSLAFDDNGFQLHPCAFSGTRSIWNNFNIGFGEVESATFSTPCKTSIVNCTAEKIVAKNLPWSTQLFYVGTAIHDEIKGISVMITMDNGAACKKIGLGGKSFPYMGKLTALWSAPTSCEAVTEEGMEDEEGKPVKSEGEFCFTGESEVSAE